MCLHIGLSWVLHRISGHDLTQTFWCHTIFILNLLPSVSNLIRFQNILAQSDHLRYSWSYLQGFQLVQFYFIFIFACTALIKYNKLPVCNVIQKQYRICQFSNFIFAELIYTNEKPARQRSKLDLFNFRQSTSSKTDRFSLKWK